MESTSSAVPKGSSSVNGNGKAEESNSKANGGQGPAGTGGGGGGANGFHEKNGFVVQTNGQVQVNLRMIPGITKAMKVTNGNGSNGSGAVGGGATASIDDATVMNGIEDMKISDGMDVDEEGSSSSKSVPGPGGSNGLCKGFNRKGALPGGNSAPVVNDVVKMESVMEANGPVVNAPPVIIPKCANSKLVQCTLDGIPTFPCKRCHRIFYCSEEHRQLHCKEHEPDCKTVSSLEVIYYEEEYSMWLKHSAPHLYDTCLNFVLVWPSLTVQWLPEVVERENNILRHQLLLGTMTNQEQNHLLVCGVDVVDRSKTDNNVSAHAAKYSGSMFVMKRINHEAEVNRARYMPQDYHYVATKSSSPEVFIFDCRKHPDVPEDSSFSPLLRLRGHQKEGFGLSWSSKDMGKIISGSNDALVCLWDLNKTASADPNNGARFLNASRIFRGHEDVVEDVNWHPEHKHMFASVGDDKRLILWDARAADQETAVINRKDAHEADINAVAFSPYSEYCLATGSSDFTVAVWDVRNINTKLHSLEYHRGEVMQVQWSPHGESTLASTGKDNRVFVWDLAKIAKADDGSSMQPYDDDPAPSELAFIHGGHIANVNDISWNHHDMGMIASVTEDNILQVWKISEDLQAVYVGEADSDEESQESSDALMDD